MSPEATVGGPGCASQKRAVISSQACSREQLVFVEYSKIRVFKHTPHFPWDLLLGAVCAIYQSVLRDPSWQSWGIQVSHVQNMYLTCSTVTPLFFSL